MTWVEAIKRAWADTINRAFHGERDRTWDFEGRCTKCGEPRELLLEVVRGGKMVNMVAVPCKKHPGCEGILWPQRKDVHVVYWEDSGCHPSCSPSPGADEEEEVDG